MYSHSQRASNTQELARLLLAKFSHTTTPIEYNSPLSWTHIVGYGDIVAIFEKNQEPASALPKILLRIIKDQSILEEVDLAHFAREAGSLIHSTPNGGTKALFTVIVKSPCLAVKYPCDGTHTRRFQLKFSSDRDYYTALAILSEISCPFTESTAAQPSKRLLTSSSWNFNRPSTAPPLRETLSAVAPGAPAFSNPSCSMVPSIGLAAPGSQRPLSQHPGTSFL
ncbi:hypothetical protein ASPZODRAFT_69951 [Penicilliopsis zonata CBS 506.65]|uniref:Uncharacterized protein n=1 Tax=Penicilliopsis zonata CBS 506.65 TaxID=1073090 RepID=A0A1L9SE47_9EURO|nr:hypothetical protein ASPZODRAFT_69951 [Penicilliopsis zonata CBS 506.65]OJJ45459.1 hypothetical protein ASPZODRAFT_69951 [Penicilliopsis zonata CBS 506.65]